MKAFFRFLTLFFAGDPYPETPATIARAKAAQIADRIRCGVDVDGHPLRHTGITQIMDASRENVLYFGEQQRKLRLAKSLIEECGQVSGPAWTFERKDS